jgi:hypothetical protein
VSQVVRCFEHEPTGWGMPGKVRYVIDGETLAGVTLGSRALSFLTRS